MNDIREQILTRLIEVAATIDGVKDTGRNVQDVVDLVRPAIILHDGSDEIDNAPGRPDYRGRLQINNLKPQFHIYFSSSTKEIGPVSSTFRRRLLAAIFNDATLLGLLFDQEILYQGCSLIPPDVTEGREGRLEVELIFNYPFRVQDFMS